MVELKKSEMQSRLRMFEEEEEEEYNQRRVSIKE